MQKKNIALLFATLAAAVMAAPIEERSNEVKCKDLYQGKLELNMHRPDKSIGVVQSKKPVKPYGESMLLFDEESKDFPVVKFMECNLKGKDEGYTDSNTQFGRVELVDNKGMCIEHLPTDDPKLVALGVQKCDYENLNNKSDKQAFRSYLEDKFSSSTLGVMEKDGKTFHSQWRYKKEGNKFVLALTSDKARDSRFNELQVKNIKKL